MSEILEKLRPDRDLQCYFEKPSAIAALSDATPHGFNVSGSWRQQFDWAVLEWNRDNVFEHPLFRNLPDGNLSGLILSYEETRENCIPIDSCLYPTVDWPYLRVWADDNGTEKLYRVRLMDHARPLEGVYEPAWAEFELTGEATSGDFVGISWPGEHHTHQLYGSDTLTSAVQAIADSVNTTSALVRAATAGPKIRLYYVGANATVENSVAGHNGNRFGAYAYESGSGSVNWNQKWQVFAGGRSPSKWLIALDFSNLVDIEGRRVPTGNVRKMRWTYSADLQNREFGRSEFSVVVSNWTVCGTNRTYCVAGPGSVRIQNDDRRIRYTSTWTRTPGNYSGGSISVSHTQGASVVCDYSAAAPHELYLGTRVAPDSGRVLVTVDGIVAGTFDLRRAGEDALIRVPLGSRAAGLHKVEAVSDSADSAFYFDYLECAIRSENVRRLEPNPVLALATDWDTDHCLALAPERTAWMISSLGFHGRVNHYAGAMWFYELDRKEHSYASASVTFSGTPSPNQIVTLAVGRVDRSQSEASVLQHLVHVGDAAETIAKVFELEINSGYTAIRAESVGAELKIFARAAGPDGNKIALAVSQEGPDFLCTLSSPTLSGGCDGTWITDLNSNPRLNRAARDWNRSFMRALAGYGIGAVAAFSMELQHGDPSPEAGIAQRFPSGAAVLLNTPALQTNFSLESTTFWRQVYRDMADVEVEAGQTPYLQFGEVQWWYFPSDGSGMPFYDAYTRQKFAERFGKEISLISDQKADPVSYRAEAEILPELLGEFTQSVIAYVRPQYPTCRFEVLYPTDVNSAAFNRVINYPLNSWTPVFLDCLKTECFTYTLGRDLVNSGESVLFGRDLGFAGKRKSHLVGIGDPTTAWHKEVRLGERNGLESVVLFALDQFCLVGYDWPDKRTPHRLSIAGKGVPFGQLRSEPKQVDSRAFGGVPL